MGTKNSSPARLARILAVLEDKLKRIGVTIAIVALPALLGACGRPATDAECQEIVRRIAELELRHAHVTDPTEVKAQVQATQAAFHKRAMDQCVGKRITNNALKCVRNATTAEQIVEECFD
jgi:hypothetical protein